MNTVHTIIKTAFEKTIDFVASTSFRHRAALVAVPAAVYAVTKIQEQVTGAGLSGLELTVATTACAYVLNWLRGKVQPS